MKSHIKTKEEIEIMRAGGKILARILRALSEKLVDGFNVSQLDKLAESMILESGATPSFKNYQGYPASVCVSVNDEVVHGLPKNYVLREGDVVSLDVGVKYKGLHTDGAVTVGVGKVSHDVQNLMAVAKGALEEGILYAKAGIMTGDLGAVIGAYINEHKMGIVKELVGHGVGRNLQEDPMVPNYGREGEGVMLEEGMTIAIEPMVTLGNGHVVLAEDGFTYKSVDGSLAAHFEHTVLIAKEGADILTKE